MGSKNHTILCFGSLLATQLLLGCQPGEKDELVNVPTVSVPTGLDHPAVLVGKWQEAKGKQTVELNADGTGEIISKVSIGASVTHGAAQSFDQKVSTKWGTKEKSFYFSELKGSPPLSYDWSVVGGKILLTNAGSKLTYTKIEEKPKK
jgi:hypothetical protein